MTNPKRWGEKWAHYETKFLKEHFEEASYEDIGFWLQRTAHAVKDQAYKLGLTNREQMRKMPCVDSSFDLWWVSEYVVDYYRKNGV